MTCYCGRCAPTEFANQCAVCGEELRLGWRHGRRDFWHREDVDHFPIFGHIRTPEEAAEAERQRHIPRERHVYTKTGWPLLFEIQEYTTESYDRARMSKAAREAMEAEENEGEIPVRPLEPIEVASTPMPTEGVLVLDDREIPVPGGVRILVNLAAKVDWEITRLTYSRGPYLGAAGGSLGVSDYIVMHVRGPVVDGHPLVGVASWRDGKSDSVWQVENGYVTQSGARALAAWMKENPRGQDAA